MISAGGDTSSNSTTWILYALAKAPKDQERVFQEIREMRERTKGEQLTSKDYDSMRFFNAVIKVCGRVHTNTIQGSHARV